MYKISKILIDSTSSELNAMILLVFQVDIFQFF